MTDAKDPAKTSEQLMDEATYERDRLAAQLLIADTQRASCALLAHMGDTHAVALRRLAARLESSICKLRHAIAIQDIIIVNSQTNALLQRLISGTTTNALRAKGIENE